MTLPFFLHNKGIEAAAGLAWQSDLNRIIISYGAANGKLWIATVSSDDIRHILDDLEHLPAGLPSEDYQSLHNREPLRITTPVGTASTPVELEVAASRHESWRSSLATPAALVVGGMRSGRRELDAAIRGGIGDLLMCTPALRALKYSEPAGRIRFFAQHSEAIAGLAYIDEVHPLTAAPPNTTFVNYGSFPPYSHIARVIGHRLGVKVLDVRPDCVIDRELVSRFQDAWRKLPHPHIIISRRAGFYTRNKDWPDVYWRELIELLTVDAGVVEIGESGAASAFVPERNYINLIGRTSLAELIATIAAADIYIGPISGPMHIAAAARKPAVVICGGYEHPHATHYPGNVAFYTPVACAPCWLRAPCPYGLKCLDMIPPHLVEKAVRDIWSNGAELAM